MNHYSIEVKICGTLYVEAETEEQAKAIASKVLDGMQTLEVQEDIGAPNDDPNNIYVSGLPFYHEQLPIVSLSPTMTIHGTWDSLDHMDEVGE